MPEHAFPHAGRSREDLERALGAGSVHLEHLVDANLLRRASSGEDARALTELTVQLEEAFQASELIERSQGIKDLKLYYRFRSGVVLVNTGRIIVYYDSQHPQASDEIGVLLWDLESLSQESEDLLEGRTQMIFGRKLFDLTVHLLYAVDECSNGGDSVAKSVDRAAAFVSEELSKARRFRDRAALRAAQTEYVKGTLRGTLYLAIAVAALGVALTAGYVADAVSVSVIQNSLGSLVAGGIGAVLSVLQRLTSGNLVLDFLVGKDIVRRLGQFRPMVGALFGIVTYAAIEGGVIPLQAPAGSERRFFFYCAFAFLAGFNERWAQDMLGEKAQARETGGAGMEGGVGGPF